MPKIILLSLAAIAAFGAIIILIDSKKNPADIGSRQDPNQDKLQSEEPSTMAIESLRKRDYQGGQFAHERNLPDAPGFRQSVVSYRSEGNKIYGLLTVPKSEQPEKGFPAILFIHGFIPPDQYSTTKNYAAYQAVLARNGFVTFKPDLRGHGDSEGDATSAHFTENYVVDSLSAIEYLKNQPDVDRERIGYWGHSNGGETGLRVIVVSKDVKAAVFWAGVVGSHEDMFETYINKIPFLRDRRNPLIEQHGLPSENPDYWRTIDPYFHLDDIRASVQLHHGTADNSVPVELSRGLKSALDKAGKPAEYFEYAGDDHNLSRNLSAAWQRTVDFYKKNL